MEIRNALKADTKDLAYLINSAGDGIPVYLWSGMIEGDESPLEAGARRADVTSLHIFVVDYDLEKLPVIGEELSLFFGPDNLPANTLVGIDKLALPEFMVEIEAFAIID